MAIHINKIKKMTVNSCKKRIKPRNYLFSYAAFPLHAYLTKFHLSNNKTAVSICWWYHYPNKLVDSTCTVYHIVINKIRYLPCKHKTVYMYFHLSALSIHVSLAPLRQAITSIDNYYVLPACKWLTLRVWSIL